MPGFYRSMLQDTDGKPATGRSASKLGVRVVSETEFTSVDIEVVDGIVSPGPRGMSVAPSQGNLPPHRIPRRLQSRYPDAHGNSSLLIWRFGEVPFTACRINEIIAFQPTSDHHGVMSPAQRMRLTQFEEGLAATRVGWELDE